MSSQSPSRFRARLSVEALDERLAPATFTVTNDDNAGAGSLRNAIARANATAGADTITFAIGSGMQRINILTSLPAITDRVVIDGRTQPGFAGSPVILVNGFGAGAGVNGFVIEAGGSGSVVAGLGINQFNGDAIRIRANNCRVVANYIGILHTGLEELSNAGNGVRIHGPSTGNVIGGARAAARNVISGNDTNGVLITGSGARGNAVLGNFIGTNKNGRGFVGNGVANTPSTTDGAGVRIAGGASGNVIGSRNVISANTEYGVNIDGAHGNAVLGNFIGTTAAGTAALGNFEDGVRVVNGSSGNVIGGATVADRNVISGNGTNGVRISGAGTGGNHVRGNRIGAGIAGTRVGNRSAGVRIDGGASGNAVVNNIVAFNLGGGIAVDPASGNTVRDNRVV